MWGVSGPQLPSNQKGLWLMSFVLVFTSAMGSASYVYEGCFSTESLTALGLDALVVADMDDNSINVCSSICYEAGFRLAGLQDGTTCVCGDRLGAVTQQGVCDKACPGDPSATCGGRTAASVYITGQACYERLVEKRLYSLRSSSTTTNESGNAVLIRYGTRSSLELCEETCTKDTRCIGYSYYYNDMPKRCFGFSALAKISISKEEDADSGIARPCEELKDEFRAPLAVALASAIFLFIFTLFMIDQHKKKIASGHWQCFQK